MIRRYVSRARGKALRAAGVPRLPNAPSPRALAQNELRRATGGSPRRRGRQPSSDGGSDDPPVGSPDRSPLLDPSRDLGEGPDELTRSQSWFIWIALVLLVWLLIASCDPDQPQSDTGDCRTGVNLTHSHDC